MNRETAVEFVIQYWMEKARRSLRSAELEFEQRNYEFSVNRAYYAAFYAASGLLRKKGLSFKKHSGVRASLHREMGKTLLLPTDILKWYDRVFEDRMRGDYEELATIDEDVAAEHIKRAKIFVDAITPLLSEPEPFRP